MKLAITLARTLAGLFAFVGGLVIVGHGLWFFGLVSVADTDIKLLTAGRNLFLLTFCAAEGAKMIAGQLRTGRTKYRTTAIAA